MDVRTLAGVRVALRLAANAGTSSQKPGDLGEQVWAWELVCWSDALTDFQLWRGEAGNRVDC
jgi:hypothetical protein